MHTKRIYGVVHEGVSATEKNARNVGRCKSQLNLNVKTLAVVFIFSPNEQRAGGGGGVRCQTFSFSFFPCSADHERDWPPCKVVFFGLATNALNVRNNNNNNNKEIRDVALLIGVASSVRHCVCCSVVHLLTTRISSAKPHLNVLTISRHDWVDAQNDKRFRCVQVFV